MGSGSFLSALGMRMLAPDGESSRATAVLGPGIWAAGTRRPRIGAVATMVDVVAGLRPTGTLWPTVDLSVQLVAPLPAEGRIDLVCHPLKTGRRLFVGEVLVHHEGAPLARAVTTFLNQEYAGSSGQQREGDVAPPHDSSAPFDDWLNPKDADERTILVQRAPAIMNGSGTIQGGALAIAAELAAERAPEPKGTWAAAELDIRYLGPVLAGPLKATADVVAVQDDRAFVSVRLTDAGADDRPVAYATTVCVPA
ncbi:hotdog domain-containing protein [Actinomadura sp. 7K507]|uniref:PaaI family thioesterase n=1 Tax=Actinomadura sp. 7K507 TaxID=2530365 RepID=UPI00104578DD|nr:hotdog domain-containing protein [Actinomadura sp. 7K507]TDC85102.1 hypothetical protein E1285_25730 [Actinomadura sp. 7K507]